MCKVRTKIAKAKIFQTSVALLGTASLVFLGASPAAANTDVSNQDNIHLTDDAALNAQHSDIELSGMTPEEGQSQGETVGTYEIFLAQEGAEDPHFVVELEGVSAVDENGEVYIYDSVGDLVEIMPSELETPEGETVSASYDLAETGDTIKIYPDVGDLAPISAGVENGSGISALSNNCARNETWISMGRGALTGGISGAAGGPAGAAAGTVAGALAGALKGGVKSIISC